MAAKISVRSSSDNRSSFTVQIAETVIHIDARFLKRIAVCFEDILKERSYGVPKDNRIGYLHHRRFHVQRK